MWRPWSKSPVPTSTSTSSNFAFPSFKDIEAICAQDSNLIRHTPIFRRLPSISISHRLRSQNTILRACSTPESLLLAHIPDAPDSSTESISLPGAEARIVVYYTSLRVVRPTFEACKAVLAILQGFRVPIDERDLSMDSSFLSELKKILKDQDLTLPRIFIGGRYVGGADEVKQLHECGELKKLLARLPTVDSGVCQGCGGFRFVLCGECSGSRKIYTEKGGFRSCNVCNENGLVRCPACSFQSPLLSSS